MEGLQFFCALTFEAPYILGNNKDLFSMDWRSKQICMFSVWQLMMEDHNDQKFPLVSSSSSQGSEFTKPGVFFISRSCFAVAGTDKQK